MIHRLAVAALLGPIALAMPAHAARVPAAAPALAAFAADTLALAFAGVAPRRVARDGVAATDVHATAQPVPLLPLSIPLKQGLLMARRGFLLEAATGLDLVDPLAGGGRLAATTPIGAYGGRALSLELGALRTAGDGRDDARLRSETRLHAHGGGSGAWLGVAGQRLATRDDAWRPLFGAGGWTRAGAVTLAASVARVDDRVSHTEVTQIDSIAVARTRFESVARAATRAAARWGTRTAEFEAAGGVVLGGGPAWRWAEARVLVWPWRRLGVVAATASRAPLSFESSTTPDRRWSLGLRFDPSRADATTARRAADAIVWRVRPGGSGRRGIEVRAPGARTVELTGDFTGWSPVALRHLGAAVFRGELELSPGVHRVAVRIDGGAWRPPPGLPTALDEFGGTVGVLVVE